MQRNPSDAEPLAQDFGAENPGADSNARSIELFHRRSGLASDRKIISRVTVDVDAIA
jgi:hypothetical protein